MSPLTRWFERVGSVVFVMVVGASVAVAAPANPCVGNVDDDEDVDFDDLLIVLADWGCEDEECPGDVDGSGATDFDDLLLVLAGWGPCPRSVEELIEMFAGPDGEPADEAYAELYAAGVKAIGSLIGLEPVRKGYAGIAYQNEFSSPSPRSQLPVALVALYVVDGMLLDHPAPHYAPRLLSLDTEDPELLLSAASQAYQLWWLENEGLPLEQLRLLPHPLAQAGVFWHGPLVLDENAEGTGTKVADSETPSKLDCTSQPDGPDKGNDPDPYAWIDSPKNEGGPAPYNCLAWAINCHTDRWISVDEGGGDQWKQILDDYGYDSANPVDCDGQCPEGRGPKVKMIFHVKADENGDPAEEPKDKNWVHAMKQEADGDWSSKNGQSSRWKDITDCDAFLDKHYKVPEGKARVVKCYCKPAS